MSAPRVGRRGDVLASGPGEAGMVLPLTLMLMLVLGALATVLMSVGASEVQTAANHLRSTQAHFLAEAGLEAAVNVFQSSPSLISTAPTASAAIPGLPLPDAALANQGTYTVSYQAAGPETILATSTGTTSIGGGQKILRATMSTAFSSNDAIRTRKDLTISGNPTVSGACGSVHTNEDLRVSGNPTIEGAATASGTYDVSGSPSVGPGSGGGKPLKPIPVIDPGHFLNYARANLPAGEVFQMLADGRVLDGNGAVLATLASGAEFNGWKYLSGSPTRWDLSGNTGFRGTYYLEGDAKISGNPGSPTQPWNTTVIATGDIEVSGNPEITTHLRDTLFVAGRDVKISGNPLQGFNGLIAAHEQFTISGNPRINGYIIAEDAAEISHTVIDDAVSGNPEITYDCGLNPPLLGPLQILTWGY